MHYTDVDLSARRRVRLFSAPPSLVLALLLVLSVMPGTAPLSPAYALPSGEPTDPANLPLQPEGVEDRRTPPPERGRGPLGARDASTAEVLAYLNAIRAVADLPATSENTIWSAGAVLHSRYVVRTGTLVHNEDDANPHRTPEGDLAGNNGNVQAAAFLPYDERDGIDGWMTGPFHGIRMIDPGWTSTGFGVYRKQVGDPNPSGPGITPYLAAATLDVFRGRQNVFTNPLANPVYYPKNNGIMPFVRYPGYEGPNPLLTSDCQARGFPASSGQPTGAPIYLMLGGAANSGVTVDNANTTILKNGTPVEHCRITAGDGVGGDAALISGIMGERNSIALMPRNPLTAGTYHVSVRASLGVGAPATYAWSFRVAPPDLSVTSSHVGSFSAGANGTYTIQVQNAAIAAPTARDIVVTDTLPAGLSFVSGTGPGWSCSAASQTVTCVRKLSLSPGASSAINLTVGVGSIAGQTVNNAVAVAVGADTDYTLPETNLANNTNTDPTQVLAPAACSPNRPRVQVTATRSGVNRIATVVRAGQGTLQQIRFGTESHEVTGADIDLPGGALQSPGVVSVIIGDPRQVTVNGGTTASFTSAPTEYTFFVRRPPGTKATVPLAITDACGAWTSFVGLGNGG